MYLEEQSEVLEGRREQLQTLMARTEARLRRIVSYAIFALTLNLCMTDFLLFSYYYCCREGKHAQPSSWRSDTSFLFNGGWS